MRALPEPKKSNLEPLIRLQPLYKLLHLANDDDGYEFVLTVAWILAALLRQRPFPVASMTAEQGSAKSMRARLMRSIFDPHAVLLRSPFREMREGHIAMKNCYTVAVDNLSSLPQWLSDLHCCAATGGGSTYRALYTDEDEAFFDIQRPQILNGIEDVAVRADLADRSIFYHAEADFRRRAPARRRAMGSLQEAHPDILGALLDVVAHGLSRIHSIKANKLPRMADFMKWMLACETALWPEGTFEAAYATNLAEVTATVLALDYVAGAVRDLMLDRQVWEDTPTALLAVLREMAGERGDAIPELAAHRTCLIRPPPPRGFQPAQDRHHDRVRARRHETPQPPHRDHGAGRAGRGTSRPRSRTAMPRTQRTRRTHREPPLTRPRKRKRRGREGLAPDGKAPHEHLRAQPPLSMFFLGRPKRGDVCVRRVRRVRHQQLQ